MSGHAERILELPEPLRFSAWVCALKQDMPCAFPVKVRRVKLHRRRYGYSDLKKNGTERYFLIEINRDEHFRIQTDTLFHEWAHCRCWNHMHDAYPEHPEHGPEWGVAYAELERWSHGEGEFGIHT